MLVRLSCVAVIAGSLAAATVDAGMPYQKTMTCPIGGEKFKHTFTASYSTFGNRPDGKPYGSWTFPIPIPVCPSNKLPIYSEFSKEELASLGPLVASTEFKQIAVANTPYYNAAWLMQQMGEKPETVAWMIVKASWEADGNAAQKRRYQEDYVARIMALPKNDKLIDWLFYQIRAVNGLRELGRFDEAVSLADKLAPDAQTALANAKSKGNDPNNPESEIDSAEYLVTFLAKMKGVAASRNPSSEPIALLPTREARYFCKEKAASLTPQDKADCANLSDRDD